MSSASMLLSMHGAGGDHADDVPLDKALGRARGPPSAHRWPPCSPSQSAGRHRSRSDVERHAAHGRALLLAAVSPGEGQFQLPGGELWHRRRTSHKNRPGGKTEASFGMLLLDLKILLHHWGNCLFRHGSHSCVFCKSWLYGSGFNGSRRRWSSCRCSRRRGPARSWGRRHSWRC